MSDEKLGLFEGEERPDVRVAWNFYEEGLKFNDSINLDETVKANTNFYVGR